MVQKTGPEKDSVKRQSGDDPKRQIIKFWKWQQRWPLQMGLNEIVARPAGCASAAHRLRVHRRFCSWLRCIAFCGHSRGSAGSLPCGHRENCRRHRRRRRRYRRCRTRLGGGRNRARLQARRDFCHGPAPLEIALQTMARNIEKNGRQSVWNGRILAARANGRQVLRKSLYQSEAQRPDVARGRNNALGYLRRIVGTGGSQAGAGRKLRRIGHVGLLHMRDDGRDTLAGKLQLVIQRQDIRGADMPVYQGFAVKKRQRLQGGRKNIAGFGGSERALRKKLQKVLLGIFHHDIKQVEVAQAAAPRFKGSEEVRVAQGGGVLPAKQLQLRVRPVNLYKFYSCFLRWSAPFRQKNGAVLGAAQVAV